MLPVHALMHEHGLRMLTRLVIRDHLRFLGHESRSGLTVERIAVLAKSCASDDAPVSADRARVCAGVQPPCRIRLGMTRSGLRTRTFFRYVRTSCPVVVAIVRYGDDMDGSDRVAGDPGQFGTRWVAAGPSAVVTSLRSRDPSIGSLGWTEREPTTSTIPFRSGWPGSRRTRY